MTDSRGKFDFGLVLEWNMGSMAERRGGEQLKKKKKKLLPIGRRRLASLRPCPASHVIMSESRSRDGMTYFSFTLLCILCLCLLLFLFSPFVLFLFYISRSRENETRIFVWTKGERLVSIERRCPGRLTFANMIQTFHRFAINAGSDRGNGHSYRLIG